MGKKQDKELQKYINNLKVKGKSLFYPPGYSITEDVAVQKLILLADSILQLSELQNGNFKILFGYKALDKLIPANTRNNIDNLEKIPNDFKSINYENIEDIDDYLENSVVENSQLYFTLDPQNGSVNTKIIKLINQIELTDPKGFLEIFRAKINLLDLMIENSSFKQAIIHQELIDFYFKFDVKYGLTKRIRNSSKVKVIFRMLNRLDEDLAEINTYELTYKLKPLLKAKSKPNLKTSSTFAGEFNETDFS